ncbi:fructose-bisphosphate aldolase class II [Microbacterium resistens]|uniref:Fructose-bisphosphate aldolase class II n=1 Tax=Microbacterium resistens TaxID=156977 RepID=A0ABU1SCW4_9MICO|nr:ketose-bisphosphate aldolase [Microbacterium resistens]MDR6867444.1 fructose-bisphosphate aldolase class II [Microbacterium resistens]
MALITLTEALDAARSGGYGVGAFNVTDLAQAEAVLDAAAETDSPVIVQTIAGSSAHGRDELYWKALVGLVAEYADVPVVLHLDHGASFDDCVRAIGAGFTSVMIDGSMRSDHVTPATFEENVAVTRRVVQYAHERGVSVEGELGTIGGSEDGGASIKKIVLADPDDAERFVAETGVDALAVAIGTSHGAYKFTSPPDGTVLRMDLISEIAERIPHTHLVMHGSSSLPAALRETINAHGGRLPESWGVPEAEKARSTTLGIRKINQGMDSHMAYSAAVRTYLDEDGIGVDPALYGSRGRVAMQEIVADRMQVFGQAGQAYRHRS